MLINVINFSWKMSSTSITRFSISDLLDNSVKADSLSTVAAAAFYSSAAENYFTLPCNTQDKKISSRKVIKKNKRLRHLYSKQFSESKTPPSNDGK